MAAKKSSTKVSKKEEQSCPEMQEIGRQVDSGQIKYVLEEMNRWAHFVGMDDVMKMQIAGIILVAGEKYKKTSGNKKIDLFNPATYG